VILREATEYSRQHDVSEALGPVAVWMSEFLDVCFVLQLRGPIHFKNGPMQLISSIATIEVMMSMGTTTISISDKLRKELLRVAAQLQARSGEKVDYDQVVSYLLSRVRRDEELFKKACAPVDLDLSSIRGELRRGRAEDQRREGALEAKYS
jgi:hypothetical protein